MSNRGNSKERQWRIAQRWSHVYFLSFRCDVNLIREKVPPKLQIDSFDGSGWLSIVPFHMSRIRFRCTPVIPMSALWELNLRTYVIYENRPGIYFFTLDTDSWLGQKIAKYCFGLPYRFRKMSGQVDDESYRFHAKDSFQMESRLGSTIKSSALDRWLVD